MVAITAGLLIRPYVGGMAGFLAASALALMGIAVSNVLMPVIVKRWFPDRVGTMTGLYSMALALGTPSPPPSPCRDGRAGRQLADRARACGRRRGVAVLPWIPLVRDRGTRAPPPSAAGEARARDGGPAADHPQPYRLGARRASSGSRPPPPTSRWAGWRRSSGTRVPAGTAGLLLAVTMVMGVPLAFVIPRLATRLPHQGPIVLALGACGLVGYAGLYLAPPPAPGPGPCCSASPTAPSRSP